MVTELRSAVRLTERQLDVLELLALWIPRGRIARRLHISTNTVKTHIADIYRTLGVTSRDEAIASARNQGLLRQALGHASSTSAATGSCAACGRPFASRLPSESSAPRRETCEAGA
jgi:DNA-binding CsgD family transcriptional regulator